MDTGKPNEPKEKSVPIAGVLLSCLLTLKVLFISFKRIIQACGGLVYAFYKVGLILFIFLYVILGLILIPALLIIFIIQAVRRRKNRRYIRNCIFSALWCFMMILSGPVINRVSPAIEKLITEIKILTYESTVEKIHNGEQLQKYEDMTGGINGSEDVAFFQYSPGEYEEDGHMYYLKEYYILYSEDSSCDVERIKKHARGLPLYQHGRIEMEEIKSNWYRLEVTYSLNS